MYHNWETWKQCKMIIRWGPIECYPSNSQVDRAIQTQFTLQRLDYSPPNVMGTTSDLRLSNLPRPLGEWNLPLYTGFLARKKAMKGSERQLGTEQWRLGTGGEQGDIKISKQNGCKNIKTTHSPKHQKYPREERDFKVLLIPQEHGDVGGHLLARAW